VIDGDGKRLGFQDKVQIDPSEEGTYTPGTGRRVFQAGKAYTHQAIHIGEPAITAAVEMRFCPAKRAANQPSARFRSGRRLAHVRRFS
jgi:hypothetical protein